MDKLKMDKSIFSIESTHAECEEKDKTYWQSKTPDERFEALELLRELNYGKHETSKRLSRFFEIV